MATTKLAGLLKQLRHLSDLRKPRERVWACFASAHQSPFAPERAGFEERADALEKAITAEADALDAAGVSRERIYKTLRRGLKGAIASQGVWNLVASYRPAPTI